MPKYLAEREETSRVRILVEADSLEEAEVLATSGGTKIDADLRSSFLRWTRLATAHVTVPLRQVAAPIHPGDDVEVPLILVDGLGVAEIFVQIICPTTFVEFAHADLGGHAGKAVVTHPGALDLHVSIADPLFRVERNVAVLHYRAIASGACLLAIVRQQLDGRFTAPPDSQMPMMAIQVQSK